MGFLPNTTEYEAELRQSSGLGGCCEVKTSDLELAAILERGIREGVSVVISFSIDAL